MQFHQVTTGVEPADEERFASDLMRYFFTSYSRSSLWDGVGWAPPIIDCTYSTFFTRNALCMPTESGQHNSISHIFAHRRQADRRYNLDF